MLDSNIFSNIPFFSSLQTPVLEALSDIAIIKNFASGDILFYEKDDENEIFYLLEGALKFYKVDRFENEIFLYQLRSNSMIFDISKFCNDNIITCYANCEFTTDSQVLIFNSKKFTKLMENNHDLMKLILRESFRMIQQFQCIISRNVVYDGTAKVAHMLANDLDNFNNLKKHEIAYILHIQPETLSRILTKLVRNEIIIIDKNNVKILNMAELQEIYE